MLAGEQYLQEFYSITARQNDQRQRKEQENDCSEATAAGIAATDRDISVGCAVFIVMWCARTCAYTHPALASPDTYSDAYADRDACSWRYRQWPRLPDGP